MKERNIADLGKKKQLKQKVKPRAVFHGDFRKHNSLKTYICPGNENQENEKFEAFLDLILRESDTVKSIEIIDTKELYEKHYNQSWPSFQSKYKEMIEKKLGQGENAIVRWKIISWSDRINTPEYQQAHQRVINDFEQNKYNLVAILANNVKHYKKINGEDAANNYGLEELAEFATQKGAVVFPGKLNGILKWGINHYKIPVNFISYKFKEITYRCNENSSSDDSSEELEYGVSTSTGANTMKKIHSPPVVVYSSSPEEDDTDGLLIQTAVSYAIDIKKSLNLGKDGEFEFLSGYFQYCQAFFNTYQRKQQPQLQSNVVEREDAYDSKYTFQP